MPFIKPKLSDQGLYCIKKCKHHEFKYPFSNKCTCTFSLNIFLNRSPVVIIKIFMLNSAEDEITSANMLK